MSRMSRLSNLRISVRAWWRNLDMFGSNTQEREHIQQIMQRADARNAAFAEWLQRDLGDPRFLKSVPLVTAAAGELDRASVRGEPARVAHRPSATRRLDRR